MDEIFEKLKKDGKNTVNELIQWMKDSKIIDEAKASDENARKLFEDVVDCSNVELQKFKEVVTKIAEEQKKTVEDYVKMLTEHGPKFVNAMKAGVSAFKDAWTKE